MAALNLDHLKKIVGDDPAFIRQVLQIFIRNTPKDMSALIESVNKNNYEQVSFYAHKLKSAAGAIGYDQAYEDFKKIEFKAKNLNSMEEIEKEVSKLSKDCMACMVYIENSMNAL